MGRIVARAAAVCAAALLAAPATRADSDRCELIPFDVAGRVDPVASHASLSRTLPVELTAHREGAPDGDALEWLAICRSGAPPSALRIESYAARGTPLDLLPVVALARTACPAATAPDLWCGHTAPIRATVDLADRMHPAVAGRSLLAEVGGRIVVGAGGTELVSIGVGGPRHTRLGALERYRARLRFHAVRASAGGQTPLGGSEATAREALLGEAKTASLLWGQCGIHFGADADVVVDFVDPPPRHLVAVGCELGLPASGGAVDLVAEGIPIHVTTRPEETPVEVAHAIARVARAAGLRAEVSPSSRILPGALRAADVLFRKRSGALADARSAHGRPLSTDATLPVCLGEVNLADGLSHFDDLDAGAGTLEERTLVKAYEDGDPTTIDVFVVPSFSKSGRIGESFIDEPGAAIQNVVIVDRAGIRAGARSYALAHELGHVLLDLPGHPDDFGVDRPWSLMDADAADATIFGPRRLSIEDCERAVKQSGPGAATPLLLPWPLLPNAR